MTPYGSLPYCQLPSAPGVCSSKSPCCGDCQPHKHLPVTACLDLERCFTLQKSLLWDTKGIWVWHDVQPSMERSSIFYHSKMMEFKSLGPKFSTANSAVLIKPAAISKHALCCSLKQAFVNVIAHQYIIVPATPHAKLSQGTQSGHSIQGISQIWLNLLRTSINYPGWLLGQQMP